MTKTRRQRFFDKVAYKEDGCWEWQAGKTKDGYGVFYMGRETGVTSAHRASYELFKGPVDAGLQVCHFCDNRGCVNPKHLWLGTAVENMQDCSTKGRLGAVGRPRTVSEECLKELLKDRRQGATLNALSEKYKISVGWAWSLTKGRYQHKVKEL